MTTSGLDPVSPIAATLLGAIVGSFLNVVIHRLPARDEQKAKGTRSACPACGAPIPAWLNVPIVSWLMLRGRARCCGAPISLRYPLVEALTAGLFLLLAIAPPSGLRPSLAEPDLTALLAFALHGFFCANLVANTFIDFEFRILPDRLTKPLMVVGVVGAAIVPLPGIPGLDGLPPATHGVVASLLGLACGIAVTGAVRTGGRLVFGKEAMGLGDVKLMGGVGAFLGWQGALLTFFLGCVFGAVVGVVRQIFVKDPYLAFGPYLALGAVVTLFLREELIELLTVTWPSWQREHASSPWLLGGVGIVAISVLLLLVRRGRTT